MKKKNKKVKGLINDELNRRACHFNSLASLFRNDLPNKRTLNGLFTKKLADEFLNNNYTQISTSEYIEMISSVILHRLKNGD